MITITLGGVADDEDTQQLKKCLLWIGYEVISISSVQDASGAVLREI